MAVQTSNVLFFSIDSKYICQAPEAPADVKPEDVATLEASTQDTAEALRIAAEFVDPASITQLDRCSHR